MLWQFAWALLLLVMPMGFWGCNNSTQLKVYADPWLGDFATRAVAVFEAENPGYDVNLRLLSSEVIAQRLHFGEPMDLVLALDESLFAGRELEGSVSLAPVRLVLARKRGSLNPDIPGAGGTAMPASDRPLRRSVDLWLGRNPLLIEEQPVLYANFFGQSRDFLLRGWVREGFVLESLVREQAKLLEVRETGPFVPGGLQMLLPKGSQSLEGQQKLAAFFQSEKSMELLAACHFIR